MLAKPQRYVELLPLGPASGEDCGDDEDDVETDGKFGSVHSGLAAAQSLCQRLPVHRVDLLEMPTDSVALHCSVWPHNCATEHEVQRVQCHQCPD